jgi:hypothetical protein
MLQCNKNRCGPLIAKRERLGPRLANGHDFLFGGEIVVVAYYTLLCRFSCPRSSDNHLAGFPFEQDACSKQHYSILTAR